MKVTYEVKNSYGKINDGCKAFQLGTDEDLVIKVEGVQISRCFVYLENGEPNKKIAIENLDEFTVPKDLLKEGELNIKIAQFNRTKVKTINLEPITLISEDEGFEGHSAFDELKARVQVLEEQVKTLLPLLNEMRDIQEALEQ